MTRPKILLEPDDFWALYLSALENGGIGAGMAFFPPGNPDAPHCVIGHAVWLDGGHPGTAYTAEKDPASMVCRLSQAGLTWIYSDHAVNPAIAFNIGRKVSFEEYVALLNIDIKESA